MTVEVEMAAPREFTVDSVRDFMIEKGGRVTNHELVKHFKQFLTDPYTKGTIISFKSISNLCHQFNREWSYRWFK